MATKVIQFHNGLTILGLVVKTKGLGPVKGAALKDRYGDFYVNVMSPDFKKLTEEERCLAVNVLKAAAAEEMAKQEARVKFNNAVSDYEKQYETAMASVKPELP